MRLASKTVTVWAAPTSARGYRSKGAAYQRWAKDLIFARCECEPGDSVTPHYTCGLHTGRLFNETQFACNHCGTPDETEGSRCTECAHTGAGGVHRVPTSIPNTSGYQRLKRRLARWLRWADQVSA